MLRESPCRWDDIFSRTCSADGIGFPLTVQKTKMTTIFSTFTVVMFYNKDNLIFNSLIRSRRAGVDSKFLTQLHCTLRAFSPCLPYMG